MGTALRVSGAFAQRLDRQRTRSGRRPGELVGIEHEYQVFQRGVQVDFRELIHGFRLGSRYPKGVWHCARLWQLCRDLRSRGKGAARGC